MPIRDQIVLPDQADFDVEELAQLSGLSKEAIYAFEHQGWLGFSYDRGERAYPRDAVLGFLNRLFLARVDE
jgi:hypothetical protein